MTIGHNVTVVYVDVDNTGSYEAVPSSGLVFIGDRSDGLKWGEIRVYRNGTMHFDPSSIPGTT